MIDLRRLQVLRMIAHHGTVTEAARSMHLTPSAVSQQVRQLSRELGVSLLAPSGRRVQLTPAAQALLEHADELHAHWERVEADLQSYVAGEGGLLRLCGFPSALAALAVPAVRRLAELSPLLTVRLEEVGVEDAFDRLLSGRSDLAIVEPGPAAPSADDPRFEQQPLLDERQDVLLPADHELAGSPALPLADLRHESWIAPAPGTCDQYQRVMVAMAAAGFTPRIAHHATEWSTQIAMVAGGLGICLIPRLVEVPTRYDVVRVPLEGEPQASRRILTFVRRGSRQHPAIVHGLEALRAVVADLAADLAVANEPLAAGELAAGELAAGDLAAGDLVAGDSASEDPGAEDRTGAVPVAPGPALPHG